MPILAKPSSCTGCSLYDKGTGFVPPDGPPSAPLLFLGESAGATEVHTQRPFTGDAGGMLQRLLNLQGWTRDSIRIGNTIQCRPPNDWLGGTPQAPWFHSAIDHCKVHRDPILNEGHKVIVTLGNVALQVAAGLLGTRKVRINDFHGSVLQHNGQLIVPTFHPSFLQRGAHNLIGTVLWDLQQAEKALTHGQPTSDHTLIVDPPLDWFHAWVDNVIAMRMQDPFAYPISSDIETPDKAGGKDEGEITAEDRSFIILRVNVSCHPDEGVTVPFVGGYIEELRRLHQSPGPIWGWNFWGYDFERCVASELLKADDFSRTVDLMWWWHRLQSDLPRGLGFVAPFYCLAAGTRVRLWDGTSRKISDLVTKREQVELLGADEFGRPIPVKVKQWFRGEAKNQKWVSVVVSNGQQAIFCTPEHKVKTQDGWKLAGELAIGDEVPVPRPGHNSLIHGTLLGDGSIDESGYLVFGHCALQEDWLRAKAAVFHTGVTIAPTVGRAGSYKPGALGWRCGVKNVGQAWRQRFYTGKKKHFVPPPDSAAIAVWYGDDGCLAHTGTTYNPRIYTAGFSDRSACVEWFELRYGKQNVSVYAKGTHTECVALTGTAARSFFKEMSTLLHPSMQRKLPVEWRGRYNGWMDRPYFQTGTVLFVKPWEPSKWHRRRNIRYCIEVDHPTHQYFTSGGLVSNSSYGPWKHTADSEPAKYGAVDALQNHRIGFGIMTDLQKTGQYESTQRYVHDLMYKALRPAQIIGVQIDRPALLAFKADLGQKATRLLDSIAGCVPDELLPLTPKQGLTRKPLDNILHVKATAFTRKGKKRAGKEGSEIKYDLYKKAVVVEREVHRDVLVCAACGASEVQRRHRCADRSLQPDVRMDHLAVRRWYWQEPFNPDSPDQVLAYIKYRKHQPGRAKKSQADSTNKETLKKLTRTGDPFYAFLLDYRAVVKVKGTYVDGTERRLDAQDRIHPEPTFRPSTGRLSYANPNITNVVADKGGKDTLAAGFRKCVVAVASSRLLEVDFAGSEAVDFGWWCRDPQYIRLANLGVHSGLASHVLKRPYDPKWSDQELGDYFKAIKKSTDQYTLETYDRCKRFVHGFSYGLTTHGMVLQFPEIFPTLKIAEQYAEIFMAMAPKAVPFHRSIRELAFKQHYLGGPGVHPFGDKHWFWSVFTYKKITSTQYWKIIAIARKRGWTDDAAPVANFNGQYFRINLGEDGKRCVAFLPQSTTAGKLKECMLRLFDPASPSYIGSIADGLTPLRAPIHDSLLLEIPSRLFELVAETVFREMQRPFLQMPMPAEWGLGSHLATGISAKTGLAGGSWACMEDLTVPAFAELGVGSDRFVSAPMDDEQDDAEDFAREIA